jgi:hypothetical protein
VVRRRVHRRQWLGPSSRFWRSSLPDAPIHAGLTALIRPARRDTRGFWPSSVCRAGEAPVVGQSLNATVNATTKYDDGDAVVPARSRRCRVGAQSAPADRAVNVDPLSRDILETLTADQLPGCRQLEGHRVLDVVQEANGERTRSLAQSYSAIPTYSNGSVPSFSLPSPERSGRAGRTQTRPHRSVEYGTSPRGSARGLSGLAGYGVWP